MREIDITNNATIVLTAPELISVLKIVLMDRLNIDLDELNITVIYKLMNNRLCITLDTDLLRQNNKVQYVQFIRDMKRIDPYIFTVNTALDVNILISRLFSGFEYYQIDEDMNIKIYY